MGRGNYLPIDCRWFDYEMVYVDLGYDPDDCEWAYQNLKRSIAELAPRSFWEALYFDSAGYGRDEWVLLANNLLEIRLADNEWSTAVIVRPAAYVLEYSELIGLAYRHLPNVARKLFAGLHRRGYELYSRSGPWISVRYDPQPSGLAERSA